MAMLNESVCLGGGSGLPPQKKKPKKSKKSKKTGGFWNGLGDFIRHLLS